MNVSLDGFFEGPDHGLNWTSIDEELHTFFNDQMVEVDAELYGRRLYDTMAAYWPTADTNPAAPPYEIEFARLWQAMPKVVFSTTLETVGWNSRLVRDNAVDEITRLKAQPGKALAIGGPNLAATAMRHGLIDEYRLVVHPVILGSGTPLFPTLNPSIDLRLLETRTFGSGVVYLRYQRAEESSPSAG